jgi:PKD repeat protein
MPAGRDYRLTTHDSRLTTDFPIFDLQAPIMKNCIIVSIVLILFCRIDQCAGQSDFHKTFEVAGYKAIASGCSVNKFGELSIAGYLKDQNGKYYPFLMKADACGKILFLKKYNIIVDGPHRVMNDMYPDILCATIEGEFLIFYQKPANDGSGFFKTDANGNLLWAREFSDASVYQVKQSHSGNYELLTSHGSTSAFRRFDQKGNELSAFTCYTKSAFAEGQFTNFISLSDGTILLSGFAYYNLSAAQRGFFLAKMDSTGVFQWKFRFVSPSGYFGGYSSNNCLTELSDSSIIIMNNIGPFVQGKNRILLLKYSKIGKPVWEKIYRGIPIGTDLKTIKDGNDIVFCSGLDLNYIYSCKIDSAGKIIYSRKIFPYMNSIFQDAAISPDHGINILLFKGPYNGLDSIKNYGIDLIKTDQDGHLSCGDSSSALSPDTLSYKTVDFEPGTVNIDPTENVTIGTTDLTNLLSINTLCETKSSIAQLPGDTTLCYGNTITLDAGNKTGTRLWSTGDTSRTITVSTPGKYWLQIAQSYCSTSDTINIRFVSRPIPVAAVSPAQTICKRDAVLLTINGDSIVNSIWYLPAKDQNGNPLTKKGFNILAKDSGTYQVQYFNAGGCWNKASVHVSFYPALATAGPDVLLCANQVYTMKGAGGITYKWIPAIYLSSDSDAHALAKLPATQRYYLVTTNAQGCIDTSTVLLSVRPPLRLKITAGLTNYCDSVVIGLTAFGSGGNPSNYTYTWPGGNAVIHARQSGWHRVTLTDGCSAPAMDSIFIAVRHSPVADFGPATSKGCTPLTVRFKDLSPDSMTTHVWDFGDGATSTANNPEHTYKTSGHYAIHYTVSLNGCTTTKKSDTGVTVYPAPKAFFTSDPAKPTLKNPEIEFINGSFGAAKYYWTFGPAGAVSKEKSPRYLYADTGDNIVRLVAYNAFNCTDTFYRNLQILDTLSLFIPNVFSPNRDGNNEEFYPIGSGIKEYNLKIYNCWGALIFHSGPGKEKWNGSKENNGPVVGEGVYLYIIDVTGPDGDTRHLSGNVTILK